jgi:translocator assembly and maintenance protein 41
MEQPCRLHALLGVLPPVQHALAYGSGVFEQAGAPEDPTRMVDYLLVVDEPATWHAANLTSNPAHYAGLARLLGASYVTTVAERVGVGVHFNPYVPAV